MFGFVEVLARSVKCSVSSVQVSSCLWTALNNVVHWLFHAKKLKNISRSVIGEKGLQTQTKLGGHTVHIFQNILSLLALQ